MKTIALLTFLAISCVFLNSNAEEKKPKYNFSSCKISDAYREKFKAFEIVNSEDYYSCDPEMDEMEMALFKYRYKNSEEAFTQYQKDMEAYLKSTTTLKRPNLDDYTHPKPYNLTDDEKSNIISWAMLNKYPDMFDSYAPNNLGVVFTYKNSSKRVSPDVVTFWYFHILFKSRMTTSTFYTNSYKSQMAINCKKGSSAFLQLINYSGLEDKGDQLKTISNDLSTVKFEDIPPNTLSVTFQAQFCKSSKSNPVNQPSNKSPSKPVS